MPGRRHGLLLFDFDGTLYRGDDPYRFYAEQLAAEMPPPARRRYLEEVDAHLLGHAPHAGGDNWRAVVQMSLPYLPDTPATTAAMVEAFVKTRAYMREDACRLEVPPLLFSFLERIRSRVVVAVASNAPEDMPLFERLGLAGRFDTVLWEANKPSGLVSLVENLLHLHNMEGAPVCSIGDNYENDIAPALAQGWTTAHISPRGSFIGPANIQGTTLEAALPHVEEWVNALP
jgi:FMN phosphatase YigB (HAD superfamily)